MLDILLICVLSFVDFCNFVNQELEIFTKYFSFALKFFMCTYKCFEVFAFAVINEIFWLIDVRLILLYGINLHIQYDNVCQRIIDDIIQYQYCNDQICNC